jgi:hypothetical protein
LSSIDPCRTVWCFRLLVLSSLLLAGCGLSDYERQLTAETQRLNAIDQYLDYAVEYPPKEEGEWPADTPQPIAVYLRPPKGIARTAGPHAPGTLLQRYSGAEDNRFQAVFVAATSGMKWKEFRNLVLSSFPFGEGDSRETKEEHTTGTRQRLPFTKLVSPSEAPIYFAYLYHDEERDYEVAVVYQAASDQRENIDIQKAIDASLGTLVFGPAAGRMHYKPPISSQRAR